MTKQQIIDKIEQKLIPEYKVETHTQHGFNKAVREILIMLKEI